MAQKGAIEKFLTKHRFVVRFGAQNEGEAGSKVLENDVVAHLESESRGETAARRGGKAPLAWTDMTEGNGLLKEKSGRGPSALSNPFAASLVTSPHPCSSRSNSHINNHLEEGLAMLHNLALASKLGFVCFLLAVAVRAAVPLEHQGLPSPLHALDDPLMDFDFVNTTRKRDSNQFIMTGYQSTFFRSGDCNISIPGTNEPYTYALFLPLQWRLNFTSPMPIDSKDRFTWIWTCYGPRFGDWRWKSIGFCILVLTSNFVLTLQAHGGQLVRHVLGI